MYKLASELQRLNIHIGLQNQSVAQLGKESVARSWDATPVVGVSQSVSQDPAHHALKVAGSPAGEHEASSEALVFHYPWQSNTFQGRIIVFKCDKSLVVHCEL